jgi:hypothetical protein
MGTPQVLMLKAIVTLFLLGSTCLAQSSSDGSFAVGHLTKSGFALTPAQMHDAEKLYKNTCVVVQRDFGSYAQPHPRFTVVLGAQHNEVHGNTEIWLTKWNPAIFAEGVVVVAFHQALTTAVIKQLAHRAVEYSDATVDVAELKQR